MEKQKKKQTLSEISMTTSDNMKAGIKVRTDNMRANIAKIDKVGENKATNKVSKIDKNNINKQKGITLIALVISIIVMLILASVSLNMTVGENGIITKAQRANIISELVNYQEQFETYKASKVMEDGEFLEESLTAGKTNLNYNTKKEEGGNIKNVIPDISDVYLEQLEIIKGELLLNTQDVRLVEIAKSLGIKVNPYDIVEGRLLSSMGNLLLVDEEGTLTLPESVTSIGEGAFSNISAFNGKELKTIIIPSTVKEIEKNAFKGNTALEKVIFKVTENKDGTKSGTEIIGTSAFQDCSNLKVIEFPDTLKEIRSSAMYSCSKLEDFKFPLDLQEIHEYAFNYCSNLKKIVLPQKVKRIGGAAFGNCTNLEKIGIPASVTAIRFECFC